MIDEKTKRIAIKLAGGPEKWAELPDDDRNNIIQEVEEMREALAAPNAPDDTEKDEIIIEAIEDNRAFREFTNSDAGAIFQDVFAQNIRYTVNSVLNALGNLGKINKYYEALIEKDKKYEALRGAHATVTLTPKDDAPEDAKALHALFVEAWAEAEKEFKKAQQADEVLENIQGRRLKQWLNPTDKATALFFSAAVPRPADLPGQMSFVPETLNYDNSIPINMGRSGKDKNGKTPKQAILFLSYRTDPNTMQAFNKNWGDEYAGNFFLVFAASNLFLAARPKPGEHVKISLRQLFRAMPGKTSEPNEKQLQKLLNNVLQCLGTMVYTNSKQISDQWNFPEYEEQYGQILPGKWVNKRATINGAIVDSYLEIYDVSPFLRLALDMKQVQPVSIKVLEIKMSRTETTYRVFYYLLREILWLQAKNSKRAPLITYKDLYAAVGATDRKKRFSVRNTCFKILEQWREIGFISGYHETPEDKTPGIVIDSTKTLTD